MIARARRKPGSALPDKALALFQREHLTACGLADKVELALENAVARYIRGETNAGEGQG